MYLKEKEKVSLKWLIHILYGLIFQPNGLRVTKKVTSQFSQELSFTSCSNFNKNYKILTSFPPLYSCISL